MQTSLSLSHQNLNLSFHLRRTQKYSVPSLDRVFPSQSPPQIQFPALHTLQSCMCGGRGKLMAFGSRTWKSRVYRGDRTKWVESWSRLIDCWKKSRWIWVSNQIGYCSLVNLSKLFCTWNTLITPASASVKRESVSCRSFIFCCHPCKKKTLEKYALPPF